MDEVTVRRLVEKHWSAATSQSLFSLRCLRNKSGVVFDLRKNEADSFLENFKLLKDREQVDFEVKVCGSLPDIESSGNGGDSGK